MRNPLPQRTVIMGNAGSGKSLLATRIAAARGFASLSLDDIYWCDQVALKKRPQALAIEMATIAAGQPVWVIEGVFSWLIDIVAPRATELIWLDLPWEDCKAGLLQRGPSAKANEGEFQDLVGWAGAYWTRQTPSSHAGHGRIFSAFGGDKRVLVSRTEVNAMVALLDAPDRRHN